MNWKVALPVLWVMLFVATPLAYVTSSICSPHPVLAPDEYCTFYPFIKTGEGDAIIDLSWDALGPGMSDLPTPSMVGDYYFYFKDGRLYYLGNSTGTYDLFYVFHDGFWYLSDGRVIYPEGPCIVEIYYDGRTLRILNFTEAFKNRLPLCETSPRKKGNVAYGFALGTVLLGLMVWKIREIRRR